MKNRVRAIIIQNKKLLVIKRIKKDSIYFVFPGGGVEAGEELEEAMIRECKEELGVKVKVGENFTSTRFDRGSVKQLEHFYFCEIISGELGTGDGPEYQADSHYEGSHELEWLNLSDLLKYDLRPRELTISLFKIYQ